MSNSNNIDETGRPWLVRSKIVKRASIPTNDSLFDHDPAFFSNMSREDRANTLLWGKPLHGQHRSFWYQCGDGWEEWCGYNWEGKIDAETDTRLIVAVKPERLLVLSTFQDVACFFDEYNAKRVMAQDPLLSEFRFLGDRAIDWPRVMSEFDGMEMPRYNHAWSFKPRAEWSYGWDCSSGVVWNAKTALRIVRVCESLLSEPAPSVDLTLAPSLLASILAARQEQQPTIRQRHRARRHIEST